MNNKDEHGDALYAECLDNKSCIACVHYPDVGMACRSGALCHKGNHFYPIELATFLKRKKMWDYKLSDQTAKADAGKLQISMVPPQIVRDIAEVRMYGNKKYGDPNNWKSVELQRYVDAMLRHTLAFWEDPNSVDEESGIPHYKHAECNWAFISEMMKGKEK